jgi:tetratricopeptide (TPR) repeat protein
VTLRQQFNVAEALLRRGDYDQAVTEFERVLNDAALEVEDTGGSSESKTDWQALAHLRLGQTYALLGQVDQARAALKAAQTETGTVADLATAFLNAYQNDASLTAAWQAMMAAVPLEQLIYEGQAVGLGFPIDAVGVFYRGLPIAAYLDRHPEAVAGSPAELQAALTGPGLEIETIAFADVTGDGRQDILLTLEAQDWQRVWVAYQLADDDRWRTGILTEGEMVNLNDLVPNPTGGQLLRLDDFGYGWDGVNEQAVTYYLGEGIPQPIDNPWPIIGVF